jgi:hypothetical protein
MDGREVLLVGSVPLQPAEAVFQAVCKSLGRHIRRIPDGEQAGWVKCIREAIAAHPDFEEGSRSRVGTERTFGIGIQLYRLKPGRLADGVTFAGFNIAQNALASYRTFHELKVAGTIPKHTRFQVTVPGPATTGGTIEMSEAELLPLMERALGQEIESILAAIPREELAIQLDLAVEVEKEEYDRRPADFDTPVFGLRRYTMAGTTDSCARMARMVPQEVELGFHLCAMWHVYKPGGQDLNVHVDYANLLASKIARAVEYIHLPTTPEYEDDDFLPLQRLRLKPETKLFLGVIHASDGLEGARRRVNSAKRQYADFGISNFCGLSQWNAGPETVDAMLRLHEDVAQIT